MSKWRFLSDSGEDDDSGDDADHVAAGARGTTVTTASPAIRSVQGRDKRITLRLIRTDHGGDVEVTGKFTEDTVTEGHSVQYAVMQFYALPGQCAAVSLWREGEWLHTLWWPGRQGEREWGKDWFSTIQHGDVVKIDIYVDDEQDTPGGPFVALPWDLPEQPAPVAPDGGHGLGCGCVPCKLVELARFACL